MTLADGGQALKQKRDAALAHYRAGRFVDAIKAQMAVVNEIGATKPESAEDQVRLAAFLFARGDLPSARDMHGIFLATGPALPRGETIGEVSVVEIYALMLELLQIDGAGTPPGRDALRSLVERPD